LIRNISRLATVSLSVIYKVHRQYFFFVNTYTQTKRVKLLPSRRDYFCAGLLVRRMLFKNLGLLLKIFMNFMRCKIQ